MNRFLFKCNYNPRGSDTHYFGNQLLIHSSVVVLSNFEYNHSNYTPTNRRSLGDPSAEIPDNLGWSLELFQHFYFMSQIPTSLFAGQSPGFCLAHKFGITHHFKKYFQLNIKRH